MFVITQGIGAGAPGPLILQGYTSGAPASPLILTHEFTAVLLTDGNMDPFGIDPDRTTSL